MNVKCLVKKVNPVLGGTRPETCRYYKLNKEGMTYL